MDSNLRDFQNKLLEKFLIVDKFLTDNNIDYFLIGGSALGAVRHQGFIPWDDDIDIAMPREQFEYFESLDFSYLNENHLNYYPIGKNTVIPSAPIGFIYDRSDETIPYEECPTIDIFPIDSIPDSKYKRKLQRTVSYIYHTSTYRQPAQNRGKLANIFTKIIIAITPNKLFDFYIKKAKKIMINLGKGENKCVSNIFGMKGYYKEIMPKEYLEGIIRVPFEGHMLPIPKNYDKYLTHLFGDYMTLPPKEEQVPHHKEFS